MQELLTFDENAAHNAPDTLTRRIITAGFALSALCHITATLDRGALTNSHGRLCIYPKPVYAADNLPLYTTTNDLLDLVTDEMTGELPSTCAVDLEDEDCPFIQYVGPPEAMADLLDTIHNRMISWQAHITVEKAVGLAVAQAS